MAHFEITPKKSLGQHFLADDNIARKIAGFTRAGAGDTLIEIGAGTGSLTRALQPCGARIIAVDIDGRSIDQLTATIEREGWTNVRCVQADFLATDIATFVDAAGGSLFVTGNLPYNITSQILFHLFDHHSLVAEAVFMMQKEVADRIVAHPRTKEYGILTVMTQLHADVERLMKVSPNVFVPKPRVWSSVVRFTFHERHLARIADYALLKRVVKETFGKRRKIISNSLSYGLAPDFHARPELRPWAMKRPEELALEDFIALAGEVGGTVNSEQ